METGEANRLGYANPAELREGYPAFFNEQVYPYITEGLRYLRKTQEGQQWIANLFHHVHELQGHSDVRGDVSGDTNGSTSVDPLLHSIPHIAVSNR